MLDESALARTYNHPSYADPADVVADYRRVQEYASRHPDHGRTRVGNALDLPPSRVRGWINGSAPDAVRCIQTARDYGWLSATAPTAIGDAFAVLVAGVFSCGSLSEETFTPAWNPESPAARTVLTHALAVLGVETSWRNTHSGSRPAELIPGRDARVLGRALATLGVPNGSMDDSHTFPTWTDDLRRGTRRTVACLWLLERGTPHRGKATIQLQCQNRSQAFRDSLAEIIRELTTGPVTSNTAMVTISAEAARSLPDVCR